MDSMYRDDIYYDSLVTVIGDIYYSNSSYDNKIARSRKLTELIVRRLTKYNPGYKLELGHPRTKEALKSAGVTEPFFWDAYRIIQSSGNDSTHTQETIMPGEEEFNSVRKALTSLVAYLFFDFFKKYSFGSDSGIISSFSIQPTYIRLTVLHELLFQGSANFAVAQKFILAAVKCLGTEGALQLIGSEKEKLSGMGVPLTSEDTKPIFDQLGPFAYAQFLSSVNMNAYDYFEQQIKQIGPSIELLKPPYQTRSEAKAFYEENGILEETSDARREFNLLMKFIYTGWKEETEI